MKLKICKVCGKKLPNADHDICEDCYRDKYLSDAYEEDEEDE